MTTQHTKHTVVNIGLEPRDRQEIANGLSRLLADTYLLYLKTQNYHWNVTGPLFQPLHGLFEEQYNALAQAVDEIAERIRALGHHAPASFQEFQDLTSLEEDEELPEASMMIRHLLEDHELLSRTARALMPGTHRADDEATGNLLTERMQVHEKTAWMLRSLLQKKG